MITRAMMEYAIGGAAIGAIPLADIAHVSIEDDDLCVVFDGLRREHERSGQWPCDLVRIADDIAARADVDAAGPARLLRGLIERWDGQVTRAERIGLLGSCTLLSQLCMERETAARQHLDIALSRFEEARDETTLALDLLARAARVAT